MNDDSPANSTADLDQLIADYLVAEESGEPVSREELLRLHPHFADDLRAFFADQDRFRRLASPLSPEVSRHSDLPARVRYFADYELLQEIGQGGWV